MSPTKKEYLDRAIAAIKIIRQNKPLSDSERGILVDFPGGGILKECGVFTDSDKPEWLKVGRANLRELLTLTEWVSLQNAGMQNAHYTSPAIRRVMWEAVTPLLKPGDYVLDPGCGIGGFHVEMPDMGLNYIGVEKCSFSTTLAKLIYPSADIYNADFLNWRHPRKFQLAIGNVPFVNGINHLDLEGKRLTVGLHAQFFYHTVGHLAPGGMLALLTSVNTLDSRTPDYIEFRKYLFKTCVMLGAIRLPGSGAHNGGTQVTTDLILLKKRNVHCLDEPPSWIGVGKSHLVDYANQPVHLSNWYLENPQYLIGEPSVSKLRGKNGNPATNFALTVRPNQDVPGEASEKLSSILNPNKPKFINKETSTMATVIPADKFKSNSVLAFILRENPKQKGLEIHLPTDCVTDGEKAVKFIAKILAKGFKQSHSNPKLYYTEYNDAIATEVRGWVKGCESFGAYEISPDEPVERTASRRRYPASATKKDESNQATQTTTAPNKLIDTIATLLNTQFEPLGEQIADIVVQRLNQEKGVDPKVVEDLKSQLTQASAEKDELVAELSKLRQEMVDFQKAYTDMEEKYKQSLAEVEKQKAEVEKLNKLVEWNDEENRATNKVIISLQKERNELRSQLEDLGMLENSDSSDSSEDDADLPEFLNESEDSMPDFLSENESPEAEVQPESPEEDGFDLEALGSMGKL